MKVDARPFFTVTVAGGGSARCLRPKFNPRSVGVGGSEGGSGVVAVDCTHTVTVFNPLPSSLADNVLVTLDDTTPPGRYRVLRGGIARNPAGAVLYLAADLAEGQRPYTAPVTTPPSQRLPYVATDSES